MILTHSKVCETLCAHLFLGAIVHICGYFKFILETLHWNGTRWRGPLYMHQSVITSHMQMRNCCRFDWGTE